LRRASIKTVPAASPPARQDGNYDFAVFALQQLFVQPVSWLQALPSLFMAQPVPSADLHSLVQQAAPSLQQASLFVQQSAVFVQQVASFAAVQ
jgi:hypothetical protein